MYRLRKMDHRVVVLLVMVCALLFGAGCQISIVDPGKNPPTNPPKNPPTNPPTNPPKSQASEGVFVDGEGAFTRIQYMEAVTSADGAIESVYALGQFRYIAHFGEKTIVSKGDDGTFLVKIDSKGNFVWVKSFSQAGTIVSPGGLAINDKGEPTIAVNGDYRVTLYRFDADGKELRTKEFKGIYRVSGLRMHKDGAIAMRCLVQGGKIEFGSTTISSITRMETVFLGRLDAEWNAQWALHISSKYNNSFQEHIYFAFDGAGNVWFAGVNEAAFPDLGDQLPADYKGGAFLFKLGLDGKLSWKATGSSITGHGKRFSGQLIQHLSIGADGLIHIVGRQAFAGVFAGKELDGQGFFHFAFDGDGGWKQADTHDPKSPFAANVHSVAMMPGGRVWMWGRSEAINYKLPNGEAVSIDDPNFSLVWTPSTAQVTWKKEPKENPPQVFFAPSDKAVLVGGSIEVAAGNNAVPITGVNAFIDQLSPEKRRIWRAETSGKATLIPQQTEILKDGSTLVLVALGHRVNGAIGPDSRKFYLLHLDAKGKLLQQTSFPESRFALTADEQVYYWSILAEATSFDTTSGKVSVSAKHLVVIFSNLVGQPTKVVSIAADNVNVDRVQINAAGDLVVVGKWNKGKGTLGDHTSGININEDTSKGYVALFSSDGKQKWVTDFAIESFMFQLLHVSLTSKGAVFLMGQLYITKTGISQVAFGGQTLQTDGKPGPFNAYAVIDEKGSLRMAGNADTSLCKGSFQQVLSTKEGGVYLAASCRDGKGPMTSVFKLDDQGKVVWRKDSEGQVTFSGAVVDAEGTLYLLGDFSKKLALSGQELTSQGQYDLFLASYAADGTLKQLKAFGGEGDDRFGAATLKDGQISLAGTTRGAIKLGNVSCESNGGLLMFHAHAPLSSLLK